MTQAKTVKELMSPTVLTIKTNQAIMPLCRLFFEMGIHHLPVVNEGGNLIGMLSASDVLKAFSYKLTSLSSTEETVVNESFPISELMTPAPLYVITPDESIRQVARLFIQHKIHALPVIEGEQVVGIVTATDVLNNLLERDKIHFI
ncbi:MAG: CBS domain-containing protein [Bacteroidota bacterium]